MFGLNAFKIKQAHANTSLRPSYIFLTMFSFVPVTKKAASFCACCGFIALLCGTVTSAVVCLKPFPMKQSQLKGYFLVTGDCPETFFVLNQFVLALNKPRSESSMGK